MRSSGLGFAMLLVAVPLLGQSQTPDANAQALDRLRAQIKGREKAPAGEVFTNVQFMKPTPATKADRCHSRNRQPAVIYFTFC